MQEGKQKTLFKGTGVERGLPYKFLSLTLPICFPVHSVFKWGGGGVINYSRGVKSIERLTTSFKTNEFG